MNNGHLDEMLHNTSNPKAETEMKEISNVDLTENIIELDPKVKEDEEIDLEKFYEQKQSKIEELLKKKTEKESRYMSSSKKETSSNKKEYISNSQKTKSNSKENRVDCFNKNEFIKEHKNEKEEKKRNRSLAPNDKRNQSISKNKSTLSIMTYNDYAKSKVNSNSKINEEKEIKNRSFSQNHNTPNVHVYHKKSIKLRVVKDNVVEVSRIESDTKKRSKSNKKEIKTNDDYKGVRNSIPNTTSNCNTNTFRKANNIKDKVESNQKNTNNAKSKLLEVTPRVVNRYGSFINQIKEEPPKVINKDIELLQKQNILLDNRLNSELHILREKLKSIDFDSKSTKTFYKNYSSIVLQTNETEKVSTNVETQLNTQNKQNDDNTSKIKRNIINTSISDSGFKGSNEDANGNEFEGKSVISSHSRISYISLKKTNEQKLLKDDNNEDSNLQNERVSASMKSCKYRSNSCLPEKKYSISTMNEIVDKRKENILINKIEKREDFYSKNKKWKDEILLKNMSIRIENEQKELLSYTFSPNISRESQKLCKKNDLFKISNIYERNLKWKERSNKNIQDEQIANEKSKYEECFFKPKTNVSLSKDELNLLKKDKAFIYKKNITWLKRLDESRKTAELEREEKVRAEQIRPNQNNKFYKKTSENNSNNLSQISNKDNSDNIKNSFSLAQNYHKQQTENNLSRELKNLDNIVTQIKDFQSGKSSFMFVDKEIDDMKSLLVSLKETVNENKLFVEEFDEEFVYLLKNDYLSKTVKKTGKINRKTDNICLSRNQSENIIKTRTNKINIEKFNTKEENIKKYDIILDKLESEKSKNQSFKNNMFVSENTEIKEGNQIKENENTSPALNNLNESHENSFQINLPYSIGN